MRFFVLILLVLLLPLRGGMGVAMAAEVPHHGTPHQQHQTSDVAAASSSHSHLEDCGGHVTSQGAMAAAQAVAPGETHAATDAACDACSACQSCHAVGLAFSGADVQPLPAPNARPEALSPDFVSAHAARDQKPPIA